MAQLLTFVLYAPLASFGEVAVGEQRPTADHPGRSAILGLIAAALGIRRDEDAAQAALQSGYGVAVLQLAPGSLLRDYHTAQSTSASDLKKAARSTRRDELRAVPRAELNTILSERDYRSEALHVAGIWERSSSPHSLPAVAKALEEPAFCLYLGRRSCPVALPLSPKVRKTESLSAGFSEAVAELQAQWLPTDASPDQLQRRHIQKFVKAERGPLFWEAGFESGIAAMPDRYVRHDQALHRGRWQFGVREEFRSSWILDEPEKAA